MAAARRDLNVAFSAFCAVLFAASAAFGQSTPAAAPLSSIAVSQVRTAPGSPTPAIFNAYALTREVESALDATRKFRVVSRSANEANAFADEQQFLRKQSSATEKASFLVSIEVLGVDVGPETRPIPNLVRKESTRTVGRMELRIAVMNASTRAIMSRFPIEARVQTDPVVHDYDKPPTAAANALGFVDLAKVAGKRIADRVLDEVYPVQIMQRQGAMVFLNRGEDSGYAMGEVLRVFSASGERLRDPYTGEDLGPLETPLGTVKVTDMRPRLTIAEIVTETGEIKQGVIVRKQIAK